MDQVEFSLPIVNGEYALFMNDLRNIAQAARNEFIIISQELAKKIVVLVSNLRQLFVETRIN